MEGKDVLIVPDIEIETTGYIDIVDTVSATVQKENVVVNVEENSDQMAVNENCQILDAFIFKNGNVMLSSSGTGSDLVKNHSGDEDAAFERRPGI